MNERIKYLILEAGFPKFDKMYVVSDGAELEKFAELIVRECAGQCLSDDCMRILNHFGVKE